MKKKWKEGDTTEFYNRMKNFGLGNPEVMLDSNFVKLHYANYYFSETEKKQVHFNNELYPLFPLVNYSGLHTWYLKSKKQNSVFEISLYYGGCLSIGQVCNINASGLTCLDAYKLCAMKRKDRKRMKREYISQFESEILPIMKPYFESTK